MEARRSKAALLPLLALFLASPATAQMRAADLVGPREPGLSKRGEAPRGAPEFRMVERDIRWAGEAPRNGLIAAYPIHDNLQIGVGRFSVAEIARPRTNVEAERHPISVRPREGRIAAVGLSFRF